MPDRYRTAVHPGACVVALPGLVPRPLLVPEVATAGLAVVVLAGVQDRHCSGLATAPRTPDWAEASSDQGLNQSRRPVQDALGGEGQAAIQR